MGLRRRSTRSVAALSAAGVLMLGACTQGGTEPGPSASSSVPRTSTPTPGTTSTAPTSVPSPSATATSLPGSTDGDGGAESAPFPADTSPDVGQATGDASAGEIGTLTGLRVGAQAGYDRVVLELSGPKTPGWTVRYVDEAIADASGLPVTVPGDAVLEVTLFPVTYPEGANAYDGPSIVRGTGTAVVTEVNWTSLFEGYLQAFVGVTGGQHPFRAFALSDPARIVIDIRSA